MDNQNNDPLNDTPIITTDLSLAPEAEPVSSENQIADSEDYQKILDQYMTQTEPTEVSVSSPEADVSYGTGSSMATHATSQPNSDQYLTPPPVSSGLTNSEPASPIIPNTVSKPKSSFYDSFFKYLFFLSVLVFLVLISLIFFNYQKLKNNPISNTQSQDPVFTKNVENQTENSISSSEDTQVVCNVNDETYQVGQSFPSPDGCNTCTCETDMTIKCTEDECDQK